MQVNVHEVQPGTVEMEVLVEEDQFGEALDTVLDEVARVTQLPGFRKGKAPRSMVERSVSPETLRARAIDRVLPKAYEQAMKDSGLKPLADPEVEVLQSENNREFRFKLTVHKQPEVKLGPIKDLHLTRHITTVMDEDVERELENWRVNEMHYHPVTDAGIEKGDIVTFDVEVLKDGEPIPEASAVNVELPIGEYIQLPAIDDDLLGAKAGDELDIPVSYPETFETEELQGLETVWHTIIKEVRRAHVPELTDELVKELIGVDTVDEYRQRLRQELETRAAELDRFSLHHQALKQLVETSEVVFPYILVEQEVEGRHERLMRQLQRSRTTFAQYAASQNTTPEMLAQQLYVQAHGDLRDYLIVHQIATEAGIEVTPQEVDEQIEKEAIARGARPAIIQIEKQNENRRTAVAGALIRERAMDVVFQNAIFTDENQSFSQSSEKEEALEDEADGDA